MSDTSESEDTYYSSSDNESGESQNDTGTLSALTFGELAGLKENLGDKAFRHAINESKEIKRKRKSKNAPQEISCKRPVSVIRNDQSKKMKSYDPRFNRSHGSYNEDLFKKSYGFVNDLRRQEMKKLEDQVKKEKDPMVKEKAKELLLSLESKKDVLKQHRKKEIELVKHGKKPFYLKKSDQKKLLMAEKFKAIKEKGGDAAIDKYIEKKRKKNASKKRKELPMLSL
ncbi:Protein of unknown function DUF947 domain-containing protein [Rozella allomycis CSF55]|uniref:rRNA biogenesis protein RRP36 n=1 Tax=Rozella allomycis (strain CSF55) TaxID=988480 RepID=A0A075AN68_ROZAC|nr:Protein of unknown function DUF947 domain-containing protein [Rozella allomycis CSF55]|eukprot:EPZ31188.1 Protein of unknown function DUF947 domain-containing protein [Rozella allomycis CSF55]